MARLLGTNNFVAVLLFPKKEWDNYMSGNREKTTFRGFAPSLEVPCTLTFVGPSMEMKRVRKLVSIEPPQAKKRKCVLVKDEEHTSVSDGDTDPQWLKFQGLTEGLKRVLIPVIHE